MSAIMISTFNVKNPEKFQAYMAETRRVAGPHGAEMVFSGTLNRALDSAGDAPERAVVVRFPNVEAINAWFDSEEYQALVPLREEAADMTMLSYSPNS